MPFMRRNTAIAYCALCIATYRVDVRVARGERGIWQRRFWEHMIVDDADYAAHVDYCHTNPLKQGLVKQVADWPYSTFHRDVARGHYPIDWATYRVDPLIRQTPSCFVTQNWQYAIIR